MCKSHQHCRFGLRIVPACEGGRIGRPTHTHTHTVLVCLVMTAPAWSRAAPPTLQVLHKERIGNWTRPTPQMHGLHIHTRTRFWLLGMTLLGVAQRKNSTRPTPQSFTRSDTLAGRGFIGADACQSQNCMEQETALRNSSMFSADQLRALALNLDLRGWPIRNVLFICTQMSSTAGSKIWAIKSCS